MASSEAGIKKMITLKSSDGEVFEVEEAVAMESQTIKHMFEDDCAESGIPLPNVTSKILSKVIEYCKKHVDSAAARAEPPPPTTRPPTTTSGPGTPTSSRSIRPCCSISSWRSIGGDGHTGQGILLAQDGAWMMDVFRGVLDDDVFHEVSV